MSVEQKAGRWNLNAPAARIILTLIAYFYWAIAGQEYYQGRNIYTNWDTPEESANKLKIFLAGMLAFAISVASLILLVSGYHLLPDLVLLLALLICTAYNMDVGLHELTEKD